MFKVTPVNDCWFVQAGSQCHKLLRKYIDPHNQMTASSRPIVVTSLKADAGTLPTPLTSVSGHDRCDGHVRSGDSVGCRDGISSENGDNYSLEILNE